MPADVLSIDRERAGVAVVTLRRPHVHNAVDEALIASLTEELADLAIDDSARVVVLRGAGPSFCAGADLSWMQQVSSQSLQANAADAERVSSLLWKLAHMPKPTIALVQGKALGLGVGLAACCDIVLAASDCEFGMAEVRFGLVPATVGMYVCAAVGLRQARRLFLTGRRFSAQEAQRIGLVHEVIQFDEAEGALSSEIDALLLGAPGAQAQVKELLRTFSCGVPDAQMRDLTIRHITGARASAEGREGMAAFLEKRPPYWSKSSNSSKPTHSPQSSNSNRGTAASLVPHTDSSPS